MRVKGQITLTPLLAWRLQLVGSKLTWLWLVVVAIAALVLFGDPATDLGVRVVRAVGYAVAAVVAVGLIAAMFAWQTWRGQLGAVQHLEVTDRRVTVQTGDRTTHVPWTDVLDIRRAHTGWFLSTANRQVQLARAAFSIEDAAAIDAFLVERAARVKEEAAAADRERRAARAARRAAKKGGKRSDA
ncbi:YcxB family protein [Actinotalea sp. M2MS4P-6]|uniref:YcxB family protein n=1 Tax=Actinotalea sp. M2MS4P-6 TaxID=2983762 RepID=UPI0021E3D0C5|nr:YcxB family protein [Actinotalea sp. M2MS4P-6]MCV2395056.1 YcxB family protein [Actinotalea sp. M2MS4P-6]